MNFDTVITELKDTIPLMESSNYKDRFRGEYYQVRIRYFKLHKMLEKWDAGELDFTPTCSRDIYVDQMVHMQKYMLLLEVRAELEKIAL